MAAAGAAFGFAFALFFAFAFALGVPPEVLGAEPELPPPENVADGAAEGLRDRLSAFSFHFFWSSTRFFVIAGVGSQFTGL